MAVSCSLRLDAAGTTMVGLSVMGGKKLTPTWGGCCSCCVAVKAADSFWFCGFLRAIMDARLVTVSGRRNLDWTTELATGLAAAAAVSVMPVDARLRFVWCCFWCDMCRCFTYTMIFLFVGFLRSARASSRTFC